MTMRRIRNIVRLFFILFFESFDPHYAWRLAVRLTRGL